MSIRDRIDDAKANFEAGRDHAAFIMISTAIAGSARLLYPKGKVADRKAFCTYLDERINYLFTGESSRNGFISLETDQRGRTIAELIYDVFRTNLVHEGKLPDTVKILPDNDPIIEFGENCAAIGRGWLPILFDAVIYDPQHRQLFADLRQPSHDDFVYVGDNIQGYTNRFFLTDGRVKILKQFIAAAGLESVRKLSPVELKSLWATKLIPFPGDFGLPEGAIAGLKRPGSQFDPDSPAILKHDSYSTMPYLSDHGVEAIFELAKNLKSVQSTENSGKA